MDFSSNAMDFGGDSVTMETEENASSTRTTVNSTDFTLNDVNTTSISIFYKLNNVTSTILSTITGNSSLVTDQTPFWNNSMTENASLVTDQAPFWNNSGHSGDRREFLGELSRTTAIQLWPVIAFIGTLMVVGVVGNVLVLYVHVYKFKRSSTRTFVISLACFDIITCFIAMPGEILDIRFGFDYPSVLGCKLLRTLTSFSSIASGFTLMAVSYDRYRRICNPLKRQMGHKKASLMVAMASVASIFISWPLALLSGSKTVETGNVNITGFECSVSDHYRKSKVPLIYTICLFLTFMSAFIVMSVFYSLVGQQLSKQHAFRKSATCIRQRNRTVSSNVSESERNGHRTRKISTISVGGGVAIEDNQCSFENESDYSISIPSKRNLTRKSSLRNMSRISKKMPDDTKTLKITMMLFLISLIFLLSFMPHLILKAIQALNKGFAQNASTAQEIVYNIFVRSFLINSVSNAFIYGFCSPRFRRECSNLFRRILARRRTLSLNSSSLR